MSTVSFCPHCGAPADGAAFCSRCGNAIPMNDAPVYPQYQQPMGNAPVKDSGSFGWAVLGFLIPIVGLILFLVWRKEKPRCAAKAGIGALVSFVLSIIIGMM